MKLKSKSGIGPPEQKSPFSVHRNAFTLVEIMIVVVIIGLLTTAAIPKFRKARINSQNLRIANDWNKLSGSFIAYNLEVGRWPTDVNSGIVPPEIASYINQGVFTSKTAIGGEWDWDQGQFGEVAGLSILNPTVPVEQIDLIDEILDDGDVATGRFQKKTGSRYMLILE